MLKLGIIIKVENRKINALHKEISTQPIINKFHISIYTWESKEKLTEIKKNLKKLAENFNVFNIYVDNLAFTDYYTTQLKVLYSKELFNLHYKVIEEMSKFLDKKAFSKPKQFYNTFSKKEQNLIDLYGRPNVMENFKPHITIDKISKERFEEIKISFENFKIKFKIEVKEISLIEIKEESYKILSKVKFTNIIF